MNKTRKVAGIILRLLGLFFFFSAMAVWFTGDHKWVVAGIKISLSEWIKPWWIGTGLWVARDAVRREPSTFLAFIIGKARGLAALACLDLDDPGRRWAGLGVAAGATAGVIFSIHYYYLVPGLGTRLALTILCSVISGGLHYGFWMAFDLLSGRVGSIIDEKAIAAARQSAYLLIASALVTFPLRQVDSFITEPMFRHVGIGLVAGAALWWLILAKWNAPGGAGKFRRYSTYASILIALAASVLGYYSDYSASNPKAPVRNRVILITLDTVRADHLSCYGYERKTSPNLDALAASGVLFKKSFCPMGVTDPSHASILTGYYPRTHGLARLFQKVTGNVKSMAEILGERGFTTSAVTSRPRLMPFDMGIEGFDESSGAMTWFRDPEAGARTAFRADQTSARDAFRRAANQLRKYRDRDLFIWVHFFDPHMPYMPHKGFTEKFTSKKFPRALGGNGFLEPGQKGYSPEEIQDRIDLYDGEIFYTDYYVGKLLEYAEALEPRPQSPNLYVVIADHGESLADYQDRPVRYAYGHGGLLYNAIVHVPLIVSYGRDTKSGQLPGGLEVDDVVSAVDVAPTVYDYVLGVKDLPSQGSSLRALIEGGQRKGRAVMDRCMLPTHREDPPRPYLSLPQYALVEDGKKFMQTFGGDYPSELYDLEADWNEEDDLISKDPGLAMEMEAKLKAWMDETPYTVPEEQNLSPQMVKQLKALGYIQ